jgi:hypothetical protein
MARKLGEQAHFITDQHRRQERHAFNGDRDTAASRTSRCDATRGEIHLRHQPTAKDISGWIGIGRHCDGADDWHCACTELTSRHDRYFDSNYALPEPAFIERIPPPTAARSGGLVRR